MQRNIYRTGRPEPNYANHFGPEPYTTNIAKAAQQNSAFRSALWTGSYLQMTLMSIPVKESIGIEMHADTDQYIRVESGEAIAKLGRTHDSCNTKWNLPAGTGIFIPAGTWHDIVNTGSTLLKISSIYAPPHHPRYTMQQTKEK